jgi:hypothetical protein
MLREKERAFAQNISLAERSFEESIVGFYV